MGTIDEYVRVYDEHVILCPCDKCIMVRKWHRDIWQSERDIQEKETDDKET